MEKKYESDEVEIDLKELFLELINNWGKILLAILLAGAIFFAYNAYLVTPTYTSTSILYVLSSSTSITSLTDIQIGTNLTTDYVEVVAGRPVLDQVIENLDLDMEYDELYAKISLNNPDDSRLLEITVEDEDPEMAKEIADEVAEVASAYIAEKMNQDPPSIIQYGYVSETAASPDVMKNTLMGALIGAVLAILIITVTWLVNDTITSPEDLEKKIGLNVLASLPNEGTKEYDGGSSKKSRRKKRTA